MISRIGRLTLVLAVALLSGCSDDPCSCSNDPGGLVFTRDDGSVVSFPADASPLVWCGAWEPGSVAEPALHVFLGSRTVDTPGWRLQVVLADVTVGDTLFIPNTFVWNQPDSLDLFLLDPPNELSSQQPESSGSVVFWQLGCSDGQSVEFDIDAVLASEFSGQPAVTVRGRFRAAYTGVPNATE